MREPDDEAIGAAITIECSAEVTPAEHPTDPTTNASEGSEPA